MYAAVSFSIKSQFKFNAKNSVKKTVSFLSESTHLPSLQVRARRARDVRDASAVEPLRVSLAGASLRAQTDRRILLTGAQRALARVIVHLSADLEID